MPANALEGAAAVAPVARGDGLVRPDRLAREQGYAVALRVVVAPVGSIVAAVNWSCCSGPRSSPRSAPQPRRRPPPQGQGVAAPLSLTSIRSPPDIRFAPREQSPRGLPPAARKTRAGQLRLTIGSVFWRFPRRKLLSFEVSLRLQYRRTRKPPCKSANHHPKTICSQLGEFSAQNRCEKLRLIGSLVN